MSVLFEIGKTYSFDVYPTSIIGNNYKNVTCLALMTYKDAAMTTDITSEHHQVFPYLPSGTPDSPTLYNFAKFQMQDGSTTILGLPWINIDTIEVVDTQTIVITIKNTTANQINQLRDILNANGITDFSIRPSNG